MLRLVRAAVVTAALGAVAQAAGAATFAVLHDFKGADGAGPVGGLALEAGGVVYGTTSDRGAFGGGTLFRLAHGVLTTLHDFGAGTDGRAPYDDTLLLDTDGTLYGTTERGGPAGGGTVFAFGRGGAYSILHSFAPRGPAGAEPKSGLAKGRDGALYGSASTGGDHLYCAGAGCGTIYKIDPATRAVTLVHAFRTGEGSYPWSTPTLTGDRLSATTMGIIDSGLPFSMKRDGTGFTAAVISFGITQFASGLVSDGAGFWGTSLNGEGETEGSIYRVDGAGQFWPVYNFHGRDGAAPYGRLLASHGALYGTTAAGGRHGCGTVFRFDPGGRTLTTLHEFDCKDGNAPMAGLVTDGRGVFYGTTSSGGAYQAGTVFSIRP